MKLLDLYMLRSILAACAVTALALVGFSVIMIFLQELGLFGGGKARMGLIFAIQISLLALPERVQELMPAIVLIGTLMGLGALAASSELSVMRACGLSLGRLAATTVAAGALLGALALTLSEWVVPYSTDLMDQLRTRAKFGEQTEVLREGVWLREGDRYIRVGTVYSERSLGEVQILAFDETGKLTSDLAAERASYDGRRWRLFAVRLSELSEDRVKGSYFPYMDWEIALDPALLRVSMASTTKLSSAGLLRYIRYLDENGLDSDRYRWMFWRKMVLPFSVMVMALLALPFVLGSQRSGGAPRRLFIGVMLGMGAYLLNDIVTRSGEVYGLPLWLAHATPALLESLLAAALLYRVQRN